MQQMVYNLNDRKPPPRAGLLFRTDRDGLPQLAVAFCQQLRLQSLCTDIQPTHFPKLGHVQAYEILQAWNSTWPY